MVGRWVGREGSVVGGEDAGTCRRVIALTWRAIMMIIIKAG
jgi:hypothetical protein